MTNPYNKRIRELEFKLSGSQIRQQLISDDIDKSLIAIGRKIYYKKAPRIHQMLYPLPNWNMENKYQSNIKKLIKDIQVLTDEYDSERSNEIRINNQLTELKNKKEELEYMCQECRGE